MAPSTSNGHFVVLGNTVKTQSFTPFDDESFEGVDSPTQVAKALSNIDRHLAAAGVEGGWDNVYLLRTFIAAPKFGSQIGDHLKLRCPSNVPTRTSVSVSALGRPAQLVQIEVEAYRSQKAVEGVDF